VNKTQGLRMLNLEKSSVRTGVELIDVEHFKYFDILSSFLDKLDSNERPKLFEELVNYVIYHFSHEEELMEKYDYDYIAAHKQQHKYFKNQIWEISHKFAKGDSPIDINAKMQINNILFDWFVKHIQTVDKRLCQFILEKQKSCPSITKLLDNFMRLFQKS
jgi:hemerythrin-like metal-binding protein